MNSLSNNSKQLKAQENWNKMKENRVLNSKEQAETSSKRILPEPWGDSKVSLHLQIKYREKNLNSKLSINF